MKILKFVSENFWSQLDNHLSLREIETSSKIEADVKNILKDVKKYGDDKILEYTNNFDKISLKKDEIKISNLKKFYHHHIFLHL